MRRRWRDRRVRDARGAVAVLIALTTCGVLFPVGALAVDLGMQRVARRDMQAVADVTALDMARTLASGTTPTDAMAATSAGRTQGTLGSTPVVRVYTGYVNSSSTTFVSDQSLGCAGAASAYNAWFQNPTTAQKSANAVLVTASTRVGFSLAKGSGGACRSAIAGTVGSACYTVGSYAAAVNTGNGALIDPLLQMLAQQSGAFSNSATVMAISYKGLAQSTVNLGQLAAGLGLASVNELATAKVNLHDLYVATLGAVNTRGDTTVAALNSLITTTTHTTAQVDLSKILSIDASAGSVATASMNLLDVVGGSLGVINGTNVASLNVGSSLLGIANANLQATLIQGAHQFCGAVGSQATTATSTSLTRQLGVTGTVTLNPVTTGITVPAIPGLTGATSAQVALPNNVSLDVSVAPTSTTLKDIRCQPTTGISLDVNNGLATVTLDTYLSNISVDADLLDLGLLGTSVRARITVNTRVKVTATVSPSGVVNFSIDVPNKQFDTFYPSTTAGVGLGVPALTSPSIQVQTILTVLGGVSLGAQINLGASQQNQLLNAIVSAVITPMFDTSVSNSFVNTVVNPILGLLGVSTGGADIALDSSPAPTCNMPVLEG